MDSLQLSTIHQTEGYRQAFEHFTETYPDYTATGRLDALRDNDFTRLDNQGHIYLDYTGGSLYAESQIQQHMQLLNSNVFGNPHSNNPTSKAMTDLDEQARSAVMAYFNASADEYVCIFTQNASGALKIVGESYPFKPGGQYLLTFDNHNSVNGIREFARRGGSDHIYAPVIPPDLHIAEDQLLELLKNKPADHDCLFAFPAQSNFSGVQHSLHWIETAHEYGWDVLLDGAAFAPTNHLDLSVIKPDFMSISFYKMFGYPTGVGALFVRREAFKKMHRPWFAGGTISMASVQGDAHFLEENEAGYEDGTINYLMLPAVEHGLALVTEVGVDTIHERVMALTGWLIDELQSLKHSNGEPLARIYGPVTTEGRGGTVTFNLYDADNQLIDYREVERLAINHNISIRTGCFCNPGAGEMAHGLSKQLIDTALQDKDRMTFEEFMVAMTAQGNEEAIGAVRTSLGIVSNFNDVYSFVQFCKTLLS